MRASLPLVALALLPLGCPAGATSSAPPPPSSQESVSSAAPSAEAPAASEPRAATLRAAEVSRRAGVVRAEDLTSRAVETRRAAARALARLRLPSERERLLTLLADEDGVVVSWAALGLGDLCAPNREPVVSALVARAASLRAREPSDRDREALAAIARAIGRCGADVSEKTLLDWASGRGIGSEDALLGLGDVASARGRLREETAVGLLELAAGNATAKPWPLALHPLGRVTHLPPSVVERTRDVAVARLADAGDERTHVIRALGRTDESAVPTLVELARNVGSAPAFERAEAVRALSRLGGPGQRGLRITVSSLVPDVGSTAKLPAIEGAEFGPLLAAVEALTDLDGVRLPLDRLAKLEVPADAPPSLVRRVSQLRCAAARHVAFRDFGYVLLTGCDKTAAKDAPGTGLYGGRAMVAVLTVEGAELVGKRLRAWQGYAMGDDVLARAAAIRAIAEHPELADPETPLVAALESHRGAVVAAAAEVIAKHPDRVRGREETERAGKRKARRTGVRPVGKAIAAALTDPAFTSEVEVLVQLADAAGAVLADEAREPLTSLCRSPHGLIRERATRALAQLLGGDAKAACSPIEPALPLPDELSRLATAPLTLVLESDAGELRLALEPDLAPLAVTRIRDLAREGFYEGLTFHRVVPGFVVQFGSPSGDGFGGPPGRPALACETSPRRFRKGAVGVALAGRDTGASQLFVALSEQPHLDSQYAWLGEATGPWESLVEGDRIVRARVEP